MQAIALTLLLVVRSYQVTDVPVRDVNTAKQVANEILEKTGIALQWIDCSTAAIDDRPPCGTPVGAVELVLRFVESARGQHLLNGTLGFAYVDRAAATGTLATIYADQVAIMARATGTDRGTLLGRATAHEIAHLLLGTSAHQPQGLMRAEWSASLLQRGISSDWQFSEAEAQALRDGLARRYQPTSFPFICSSSQVLSGAK